MQRRNNFKHEPKEFDEKVIQISRVSKKTKGGNNIGFSVVMVVGDKKGKVGVGLGKAGDVVSAIKKGIKKAKKKMITLPLQGTTIPFSVTVKKGAAKVTLKPAPSGSGVIAGGPVRAVVEAAGVRDISAKVLGTRNQASNVYATFEALKHIERIVKVRGIKLKSIEEVIKQDKEREKIIEEKKQEVAKKAKKEVKAKKTSAAKKAKPTGSKATKPAKAPAKKKVAAKPTKKNKK